MSTNEHEHIPRDVTTEYVREFYAKFQANLLMHCDYEDEAYDLAEAEFDRWLTKHDRELLRESTQESTYEFPIPFPDMSGLTIIAKPEPKQLWLCDFCAYPWPAGEGDPNMGKYDRCSICGSDEWTAAVPSVGTETPEEGQR